LLLYLTFGSPDALRATGATAERAPMSHEQIVAMVEQLATRMKEHPEDPAGWRLLARAYTAMGRYPDAVAAFTEAAKRSREDAALLADWADALAMRNQSLDGEPSRLVARALALDPNHPKALSLAASAALERNDYATAIAQWRRLKMQFPPGSEETKEVDAMIAEAEAAQRGAPATAAAKGSAAPVANAAGAETPRTKEAASANVSAIRGRVSLDPKLRDRVAAGDTLFIFARAANGPRMPLAVVRATAGELPRAFTLDDSMAMTPAAKISGAGEIVVEARISKSGSATPTAGDLRGASAAVKPGSGDVSVVIDQVVR
jgi:cytochrome c-type biogenesis protein CcmH